jgi:RNA polymerase sigma factor (sigma-70 family)
MSGAAPDRESALPDPRPLESTATLLVLVRKGDERARERLLTRLRPALMRWAHGRVPARARDLHDTDDLVQRTLLRALDRLPEFESRHEGALLAYLRRILFNLVRDEARRVGRRPVHGELDETLPDSGPSPVERAIGQEALENYERALETLSEERRMAVILRVEFGFSYDDIARALDRPTPVAARLLVTRALVTLARKMDAG